MSYLEELFSVEGKTALVTGAATGIGRMAATALVRAGARVLIASRKGADCERVAAELNALDAPGHAEGFAADVSTENGLLALAEEVKSRTGVLNILINNAGISWGEAYETFPYAAWSKVMNVNVTGIFHLTRELLPLMEAAASDADPARVINLGSIMGTQPFADRAYSYAASKAAVHHLTRMLAIEFASRRITVNAFAPGPFPSRMMAFAVGTEEKAERMGARIPLGRIGAPDDIAGATLYLCSRAGAYVTGAILPIDGGQSVQHGLPPFTE
ncbi:NAD(P)-dependent dehydrogenase (short-subunit alcohol dehydrogenase family) [Mesorhizobium soli]|uniref:SDR family oxidoreductase n=1 Tax=Pseudaminobacter soli (ex Li et al. 2025) TaxID=1295366 RepID=UPI0024750279|nr:SDR family oxidoreductase [Mesorhizobium soli]MDH6233597.1 NAD(P)-dependent dehydrogenase (short-subunit alcohol dehydrogenase family) [Mesorhizobium soli]